MFTFQFCSPSSEDGLYKTSPSRSCDMLRKQQQSPLSILLLCLCRCYQTSAHLMLSQPELPLLPWAEGVGGPSTQGKTMQAGVWQDLAMFHMPLAGFILQQRGKLQLNVMLCTVSLYRHGQGEYIHAHDRQGVNDQNTSIQPCVFISSKTLGEDKWKKCGIMAWMCAYYCSLKGFLEKVRGILWTHQRLSMPEHWELFPKM